MLRFAKRYRTLSSISKFSLCFQVLLFALKLLLFPNLQDRLKMIYGSRYNRFSKFVMFSLNEHIAPKLLVFLKKELTCSYLQINIKIPLIKIPRQKYP